MSNLAEQISLIQALENDRGLQYLVDEAYEILGNPLLLHNMEYELLCYTKNVATDDWIWNEIVRTGFFCNETIRFFLEECFIDAVANTKSIALLTSDKLKYERLYGRVLNSYDNTVADLIMVACDKPFEVTDAMAFEAVCKKLSQEISTNEFFKNYGILYHDSLICKLLDNDIDDKIIYSGHLSNLYEDLKENLYVAAVDISACSAEKKSLAKTRSLFKELQPEFKYAVYSDYVVIIAGTDEATLNPAKDLRKLSEYFNSNNLRAGVSSRFDNLFNLRRYYLQAVSSLIKQPRDDNSRWIFSNDNFDEF